MGTRDNPAVGTLTLRETEMAARLRDFNWAATPLGPRESWPQSLLAALGICLNSSFPMFVWWGPELLNIYNDAYIPMLGKRHGDAFGRPAREIWSEIWPTLGPQVDVVIQQGQATWNDRVHLAIERNGYVEDTWFTWSFSPIPDGAGGVGGLFCACTEDTQRVLAERDRGRLADQRQLALDAAKMGWWHLDPASGIATWDEQYKVIFGVTDHQLENDRVMLRLHPDDRARVRAAVAAALDPRDPQPYSIEYRIIRGDGAERWISAHGLATFEGDGLARRAVDFAGTVADVTERKRADRALHASQRRLLDSEARLRLAVEAAGIGYWTWDLQTGGATLDETCAALFDLDGATTTRAEDILGRVHPEDRGLLEAAVQAASDGVACYDIEFRVIVRDGSVRWLAGKGDVVRDDAGRPVRVTGINLDISGRKRVEQEVRQHRELVETVVRHLGVGAALIRGVDLRYQVVNEAYEAASPGRDFLGRTVYEAWPDTQPVFGDRCRHVLDTGQPYEAVDEAFQINRFPGGPTATAYFSWSMHRVRLPGDAGWGILISVWETTERKRIEQALSDNEQRFRFFANAIPQLAWIARPDGWIDWYNDRWFEYTGTTLEQMAGWGWEKVHDPIELQRMLVTWKAAITSGEPWEDTFPLRRYDGEMRWHLTRARPLRDADGNVVLWFGTNTDIEDQRRTAAALRESQDRFRSAVTAATDILWTNNAAGQMVGDQPGWGGFTGQNPDQYHGYGWSKAVHPDDAQPTIAAWEEAVREKKAFVFEHRVRRRDGVYRVCAIRAVPVKHADGSIREWVGVHTDLTEQRKNEERREQLLSDERTARAEAERVGRMKDEFLATLSHELRTPLNAILGWSQMIHRGQAGEAATLQGLAVIERNARAQAQLIEDLLDMSRIVSGKIRLDVGPVTVSDVIEEALETVRPSADVKTIRLTQRLDPGAPLVNGDPQRLLQVVWNLLSNAVKFTSAGGTVEVTLRQVDNGLEIAVSDTGQGIKPEFMPHMFQRFQQGDGGTTRQHGGLGLGLAIVKQLVELHGGSVRAASGGEGQGATFTVQLPVIGGTITRSRSE